MCFKSQNNSFLWWSIGFEIFLFNLKNIKLCKKFKHYESARKLIVNIIVRHYVHYYQKKQEKMTIYGIKV